MTRPGLLVREGVAVRRLPDGPAPEPKQYIRPGRRGAWQSKKAFHAQQREEKRQRKR
tara:strand:+ start:518 stop:688 length:171 start_codon:yes stop_codon:yes gene_type:complete